MRITDVLRGKGTQVVTVPPDTKVRRLLEILAEHRIGAVVVSQDGVLGRRDRQRAGHRAGVRQARRRRDVRAGDGHLHGRSAHDHAGHLARRGHADDDRAAGAARPGRDRRRPARDREHRRRGQEPHRRARNRTGAPDRLHHRHPLACPRRWRTGVSPW